jgi:hypothetical protein
MVAEQSIYGAILMVRAMEVLRPTLDIRTVRPEDVPNIVIVLTGES